MRDTLKVWWSRIGISLVPVLVTLATALFGNSVFNVLGEGYSTLLYLVVILSTEVVISLPLEVDEATPGNRAVNVLLLLSVSVIWASFVISRALSDSIAAGPALLAMLIFSTASIYPAYLVFKKHRIIFAYLNVSREIEVNEKEPVQKMTESKPTKAKDSQGNDIDV